ncbi:hypothetical protein [Clostridium sp.]|uniref:hypothetical protein n=1 Tax=Clostridium sp. TaxID=1506 RepID=UPI002FCC8A54
MRLDFRVIKREKNIPGNQDTFDIANLNKKEIELLVGYEKDFYKITGKKCALIAWEEKRILN